MIPLIGSLGTPELLILFGIVVLLFGASKLPELARGSGRALRIFKAETKGLTEDDGSVTDVGPNADQRELAARADPGSLRPGMDVQPDRSAHPESA